MADSFEIIGTLRQKMPVQSGKSARGDWQKQEFVLDFPDGNFTSSACFSLWGADRVKDLDAFQVGDQIHVWFHINGREYNGRWYTDLRAWRVQANAPKAPAQGAYGAGAQQPYGAAGSQPYGTLAQYGPSATAGSADNVPAGFGPRQQAPAAAPQPAPYQAPTESDIPAEDSTGDDLPF